jgi:N-acetylneuraminate synthase
LSVIRQDVEVLIVAEMSGNHNQSLTRAIQIIEAAADCGVDAVKLQTYTADTMTLDVDRDEFQISNPSSLWHGRKLHDLYSEAHTPWNWHQELVAAAKAHGLMCFSTPFDETSVDFLESLDMPMYKIASFENTDHVLIRRVAQTGKPIVVSTGMATLAELTESVNVVRSAGCTDLTLLKCTSTYPAPASDSNLLTIPDLQKRFNCKVGLSDHTLGIGVAVAAVALGAAMIEKHFTLDRADGGVDAAFSLEPDEMRQLVTEVRRAHEALGDVTYGPTESEVDSLRFRRSLYVVKDCDEGELLTPSNIRSIRPGFGLEPKFYEDVLGKKARVAIGKGTPLSWDLVT